MDANFDLLDGDFGKVVPQTMWNDQLLLDAILVACLAELSMDFFRFIVRD